MRLLVLILVLFGIGGGAGQVVLTKCPPNWLRFKDFCYAFINNATEKITWLQANNECIDLQGHILRIETQAEYDFLKKNIGQYPPSSDGYWTALNDLPQYQGYSYQPSFMWGKDEFVLPGFIQWEKGTDDFGTRHCGNIDIQGGLGFGDCGKVHGYICEAQPNSTQHCPSNWLGGPNNMCYYISTLSTPTMRNWDGARKYCQALTPFKDQTRATLLSLRNSVVQSFLATALPNKRITSQVYWTGLTHMTQSSLRWAGYTDPFNAEYVKWRQEPNNLANSEHCGAIKWGGVFADVNCRTRLNYICRITLNSKPTFNHGCGAWTRAGHKCVLIHHVPRKNWSDARADCLGHGADLYKYGDDDDALWLRNVAQNRLFLPGYYVGLNDRSSEGHYVWADGSASQKDLLDWNQEPNYHRDSSTRFCAVIQLDGTFATRRCVRLHAGSICEYKASTCPPQWIANANGCYLFDSVMRTHDEASDNCKDLSGRSNATLLAVNSQDEKNFVMNKMNSMSTVPFAFWTDLKKPSVAEDWQYTVWDSKAVKLIKWSKEPNNYNNQDCVFSDPYGYLSDVNCSRRFGFICQYDLNSDGYGTSKGFNTRFVVIFCDSVDAEMCLTEKSTDSLKIGDQRQASFKLMWFLLVTCLASVKLVG